MSGHVTPRASELFAVAAFQQAEVALFDGARQVTEWRPYDVVANAGVESSKWLDACEIALRTPDGSWVRWPVDGAVRPGDVVMPPPLSSWFEGSA